MFAVNICVSTVAGDRYDKVAINTTPIIITAGELREQLASDFFRQFIESKIRTPHLLATAEFHVLIFDDTKAIDRMIIPLKDIMDINLFATPTENKD
jgi:hypothetical protein